MSVVSSSVFELFVTFPGEKVKRNTSDLSLCRGAGSGGFAHLLISLSVKRLFRFYI